MKSKPDINKIFYTVYIILIVFFFLPTFKYSILNTTIYSFSLYDWANGKNLEFSKHTYAWLLIIIPILSIILTFINDKTAHKIIAVVLGIAALLIFTIADSSGLNILGKIYIASYGILCIIEIIRAITEVK
jgi:uncharacterized membrane protein YbaN (DUF454 family)